MHHRSDNLTSQRSLAELRRALLDLGWTPWCFPRGFLLSNRDAATFCDGLGRSALDRWRVATFGPWRLYFDPAVPLTIVRRDRAEAAILGSLAFDVNDDTATKTDLLNRWLDSHAHSRDRLFAALEGLSGRFLGFARSGDSTLVFQDGCGTRSAFYEFSDDGVVVSSHGSLIASLRDAPPSALAAAFRHHPAWHRGVRYYPGLLTPYGNVRLLTPNTTLDLERRTVERFFPRSPLPPARAIGDVLDECRHRLQRSLATLHRAQPLAIGLTAGRDSRLTFALARHLAPHPARNPAARQPLYFTYYSAAKPNTCRDRDVARELCRARGAEHRAIAVEFEDDWAARERDLPLLAILGLHRILQADSSKDRNRIDTIRACLRDFPRDRLQIRSNLGEAARGYAKYFARMPDPVRPRPEDLPTLCNHLYGKFPDNADALAQFGEFAETVQLHWPIALGYDLRDILYWEHRLGTWYALSVLDYDLFAETTSVFNSRPFLTAMLSLRGDYNRRNEVWDRLTAAIDPEALNLPINPPPRSPSS